VGGGQGGWAEKINPWHGGLAKQFLGQIARRDASQFARRFVWSFVRRFAKQFASGFARKVCAGKALAGDKLTRKFTAEFARVGPSAGALQVTRDNNVFALLPQVKRCFFQQC
jgi:hypothetical protein